MSENNGNAHSRLFLVRVWQEETSDGGHEWGGKVQAVVGGESYRFDGWPALIDALQAMLPTSSRGDTTPNPDASAPLAE